MKDVSLLKKKLAGYSAMAGTVMAFSNQCDAQIIYTDVNPDTVSTINNLVYYSLDLNNDGIYDFVIHSGGIYNSYYGGFNSFFVHAFGINSNSVMGYDVPYNGLYYASVLNQNDIISQNPPWLSSNWFNGDLLEGSFNGLCGLWDGATDKYLGLKFHLNGHSYYGWARLDVYHTNGMLFTLKDYAYQSIPDSSILAGAFELPTQVNESNSTNLFNAFIETHHLILHFPQSSLPTQMILYNEVGVKMREQAITQSQMIIDVSNLACGIYLIAVDDGEKWQVKKVVIE